jgi:hypothetical protein
MRTDLSGFNEVLGPNLGLGAILSSGSGRLRLKIDTHNREIHYELTYDFPDHAATPLLGTGFVNQAHLHFGQKHTTGGIVVWLCQGDSVPATPIPDLPQCPNPPINATVSGTIGPAQVLAQAGQGFPAGEAGFDALLDALRNEAVYANVHTDRFAPGEIRGQLEDRD